MERNHITLDYQQMAYLLSDTIFNGMKRNRVIQSFMLQMPKTTSYTVYV